MNIAPARVAAFEILKRIETENAFSTVLLPEYEAGLSRKDAALCHELVLGVLRRQIFLDRVADALGKSKKLDLAVRISLRLGVYQLLYLDRIPGYSAVNESVNLVRRARKTSARGYVNAVLRGLRRGVPKIAYHDAIERLSVEYSHPRWLVEKWRRDNGEPAAAELLAANNRTPDAAFRVTRRGVDEGYKIPSNSRTSDDAGGCFIPDEMNRELLIAAEAGKIYFQDVGSQIVGQAVSLRPGERFLDACAAPGGKTTQIAVSVAADPYIVAGDRHFSRVRHLRANCERQGVGFVNILQYDAEELLPFPAESFEAVLVDAPCTGTGTMRHNPEIRYRLKPDDPIELAKKQLKILQNAAEMVKKGGRLIYSTCSLEWEENEAVARDFAASNGGFEWSRPEVAERFLTRDGFARTCPARDGLDGFFIAAFERVAE